MKISIGTRIKAAGKTWTVVSCGSGKYGIKADGSSLVMHIPCKEAKADIAEGRAEIIN